ncbi:MAG: SDR family NAD(P)-dependent oxidoreductase [Pseudomonadota bacterium]
MKKKYLVTGGTGFIGAALVKRLLSEGHAVKVIDNNSRGAVAKLGTAFDHIEFVEADVRDTATVTQAAKGVESIIHLAFINGTEHFYSNPELVLDVGIRGMLSVIDACRINGIGELVLASSSEVYQTPPEIPTAEDAPLSIPDPLNPRYSYAGGKIISELIAINYGRTDFERVMIFRPHNIYGPDMGWEHVIPQFIKRAGEQIERRMGDVIPFDIQGDGRQTRAFCYIDDFVDGLQCVLTRGTHLGIYHIGNPEEITIQEVAEKVVGCFGKKARIIPGDYLEGGTHRRCPAIGRLAEIGYKPIVPFDDGLTRTVAWYRAHL